MKNNPLIIIGMHRSGTSLLTQLLEVIGIYFGRDKNNIFESQFFSTINKKILRENDSRWDYPQKFARMIEKDEIIEHLIQEVNALIKSKKLRNYLPYNKNINSFDEIQFYWGWKDPRNSLTLPVWKGIFPKSTVIHIRRHGLDVAKSLVERRRKKQNWLKLKLLEQVSILPIKSFNLRVLNISDAFKLWTEYLEVIDKYKNRYGYNIYELKYEELILKPTKEIKKIIRHINLETKLNSHLIDKINNIVNSSNSYKYLNDINLVKYEQKVKNVLRVYGY